MHWQDDKPIVPKGIEKARKAKFWLDDRGVPLPQTALAALSKHWSPEEWETYLQGIEVPLREDLGQSKDRLQLLNELGTTEDGLDTANHNPYEQEHRNASTDSVQSVTLVMRRPRRPRVGDGATSEEIIPADEAAKPLAIGLDQVDRHHETRLRIIERAIQTLTRPEQLVIWHLFWEGRTEREIVRFMRRSRRSVRTWRDRAFAKLRAILSPIFRKEEKGTVSLSVLKRRLRQRKKRPISLTPRKKRPKLRIIQAFA